MVFCRAKLLFLTGLLLSACGPGDGPVPPNIFLITVDTVRADRLGCYGYGENTSPHVDEFAKDALLFENCYAHAPDTRMSFASILSGYYPNETKITATMQLPPPVPTIQKKLRRNGYKTVAVISNYVLRKKQGFDRGFDVYDDTMESRELVRSWPERVAENTTKRAVELMDRFRNERLFMWVHYQDPHGPYAPPEKIAAKFRDTEAEPRRLTVNRSADNSLQGLSGRGGLPSYQYLDSNDFHFYSSGYEGEIFYFDQCFKEFLNALKSRGLYEDALIIFTSDHGEGLGEHDYYFAHGEYLYNHQLHVPLIIRHGKRLIGRQSGYVQHIDIVPTLLKAAGIRRDDRLRGTDLCSRESSEGGVFSMMHSPLVKDGLKYSLVREGYKLIYTPLTKQYELYDLSGDHGETKNLSGEEGHAERLKKMVARLTRIVREDRLRLKPPKAPANLTEEEKRRLRALGYGK